MNAQSCCVSMQELGPLMAELLSAGQSVRFSPKGTSMLPMLREGRDSVVLSPLPKLLRRYDLALYRRDNGTYVLHRIVDVGQTYTCLGDNQFLTEPGLRPEQFIAVVSEFRRGGRDYSVTHPGYRLYCRVWYHSRGGRRFVKRLLGWIRRCL